MTVGSGCCVVSFYTINIAVTLIIFCLCREQRSGNTLYQELSFQDVEALGEMDEGADITGDYYGKFYFYHYYYY